MHKGKYGAVIGFR